MSGQLQVGPVHGRDPVAHRAGLVDAAHVPGQRLGHVGGLQPPQVQRPAVAPSDGEGRQQPLVGRPRCLEVARHEHLTNRSEQGLGVAHPRGGLLVDPAVAVAVVPLVVIGVLTGGDPGREPVDLGQQVGLRRPGLLDRAGLGVGEDVEERLAASSPATARRGRPGPPGDPLGTGPAIGRESAARNSPSAGPPVLPHCCHLSPSLSARLRPRTRTRTRATTPRLPTEPHPTPRRRHRTALSTARPDRRDQLGPSSRRGAPRRPSDSASDDPDGLQDICPGQRLVAGDAVVHSRSVGVPAVENPWAPNLAPSARRRYQRRRPPTRVSAGQGPCRRCLNERARRDSNPQPSDP